MPKTVKVARSAQTGEFVTTKDAIVRIAAASAKYVDKHAKSQSAARKKMNELGITTKTGKLTKNYKCA